MKNKKGFTLIELLAVIIILGVLMIIAIPAVTKYIEDSRKNGYISTAKSIVNGARNLVHSNGFDLSDTATTYYIDGSCIKADNGYKSPYDDFDKAYVAITTTEEGHEYFWMSVDKSGKGIKTLKNIEKLDIDDIESGVSTQDIEPNIGIDKKNKIVVIDGENCTKREAPDATKMMNSQIGRIKEICPPVSETIYWALKDNNSDGKYDKLTISDSVVTGDLSGNFPGNSVFTSTNSLPWIVETSTYSISNISRNVSEVEIIGTVVPVSTANWFYAVGVVADNMYADLYNLEMCHVTDMYLMFTGFGSNSSNLYLDIRDWDTSKVTNMSYAFYELGKHSNNWIVKGIEDLDTRNVTKMFNTFEFAASKVSNLKLDLSKWNTSKVTTMYRMFNSFGLYSNTVDLNLSSFNTSKVTNMNDMFTDAGKNAINFNIIIPSTNGNGINNTTTTIYGNDMSISSTVTTGKQFTLAS